MAAMKKNAVKRVHKYFTWANVACIVSEVYERIIASHEMETSTGRHILIPEFSFKNVEKIFQNSLLQQLNTQ
jgi:hypothetical protein